MFQHQRAPLTLLVFVSISRDRESINHKKLTMSNEREIRSAPLGLRITPSLKAALEAAAADDRRSVASKAEIILTEWLEAHGYLGEEKGGD